MGKFLDHIAVEVGNINKSIKFYKTIFGFKPKGIRGIAEEEQQEFCFLEKDGILLEMVCDLKKKGSEKREVPENLLPHICFITNDLNKTMKKLKQQKIKIIRGPLRKEGVSTWLNFTDPDGNVIEYIQWLR
jgi:catechol 2,3-dioxygenase-like lactoylglutathione lyase family enzyme